MITYTSEHIQACARFVEEHCYNPDVLYGSHPYSDSEIYKTILGECSIYLNETQYGQVHDIINPFNYIEKWFNTYNNTITDPILRTTELKEYIQKNNLEHNLDMDIYIPIKNHNVMVDITKIENIVTYGGHKRGFNLNPIEVYIAHNNKWRHISNLRSITRICVESLDQLENNLIKAIHLQNKNILSIHLPNLYNDIETFPTESNLVKLNAFILYSRLNNLEFDTSKKHLIELAIDMQMSFEQTLEMYKHHTTSISPCDYPELP